MSYEELKKFYKSRVKKPDLFTYDDDGNLVSLNKEGTVIKTIALPDYRSPTFEEIDDMEQKRMEEIAIVNKEFEDSRRELRDALSKPDTPDSEILRINRKIKEADIKLLNTRFPLIYVSQDNFKISDIDLSNQNEKRKYPYFTYILNEAPFRLQDQYVRIGKAAVKPLISVAEAAAANTSQVVILFAEPETNDYGFLSLKWAVEIDMDGTMYNSAHQALAAKLASGFNDETNLQKIMLADTPDEVTYKLEDVPGDSEINETKWNDLTKQFIYDINIAKFNQYPELTARLLETQNATLGAYLPDDTLIGIGISLDNIQSKNPVNWTGQNILGKALMDIRDKIRFEREMTTPQILSRPVRQRKKPVVASKPIESIPTPPVSEPSEIPSIVETVVPEAAIPESVVHPETEVPEAAIGIPRPIRRRPKPAVAPIPE